MRTFYEKSERGNYVEIPVKIGRTRYMFLRRRILQ